MDNDRDQANGQSSGMPLRRYDDEEDGIIPNKKHKYRYPVIVMERLKGEDIFYRIMNSGIFSEQSEGRIFTNFIQVVHDLPNTSRIIFFATWKKRM